MSRHRTFPLRGLTPEERQFLVRLQRSATAPASQVARAKVLLAEAAPSATRLRNGSKSWLKCATATGSDSGRHCGLVD
jgi:hypothetical protein